MGPCSEEAACRARDTACPAPPPACGGSGAGKQACPFRGGPPELPWPLERAWGSSWLPGGDGAGAHCPLSHRLSPARKFPQARGWAMPWVPRALGLSDQFQRHCLCPILLPPTVLLPNPGLCHAHRWHTMTHMVTEPLKGAHNHLTKCDTLKTPTHSHVQVQDCTPRSPSRPPWSPFGPLQMFLHGPPRARAMPGLGGGEGGLCFVAGFSSPESLGRKLPLKS